MKRDDPTQLLTFMKKILNRTEPAVLPSSSAPACAIAKPQDLEAQKRREHGATVPSPRNTAEGAKNQRSQRAAQAWRARTAPTSWEEVHRRGW